LTESIEIPDKLFFKIGEVSRLTGVKPHVLRYWESEFPNLAPPKNRSSQRVYRRKDIETVLVIKGLLYEDNFTISGARKKLREMRSRKRAKGQMNLFPGDNRKQIQTAIRELEEALNLIKDGG